MPATPGCAEVHWGCTVIQRLHEAPIQRSLFLFHADQHLCALPVASVQEIVHISALSHLPGQPPILSGFLNLRGRAVPVVQLTRLLGLQVSEPELYDPVIIMNTGNSVLGLIATRADDVLSVESSDLGPVPSGDSLNGCAEAQFQRAQGTVTLLSPQRLLLEKEKTSLAELAMQAERRLRELEKPGA